jgi:rhodanese-related sulfurtransferase
MLKFLKSLFGGSPSVDMQNLIAEGAVVIDVRTPQEFNSGHYDGSKNIPLDKIEANVKTIKNYGKPIIVCCASGMRSANAKRILENKGIENVYNAGSWRNL